MTEFLVWSKVYLEHLISIYPILVLLKGGGITRITLREILTVRKSARARTFYEKIQLF